MNAANFHEYLKNPSMLHQVNYQELKSLSLQYPYAANLRYLLLVKSLMDKKRESERNLALASLSSIDRKKLRQLVILYSLEAEKSDNYEIAEEFLELKDLSTLEEVLDIGPEKSETLQQHTLPLSNVKPDDSLEFLDDLHDAGSDERVQEDFTTESKSSKPPVLEELLDESVNDPISNIDDLNDELLLESEPRDNVHVETIAPQDLGDIDDIEIEESLDGLFDVAEEEIETGSVPEESLPEVLESLTEEAGRTATDEALIAEAGQNSEGNTLEEMESPSPPDQDIPFEITNEEPTAENSLEDTATQPTPSPKTAFTSYQKVHRHKSGLLSGGLEVFKKEKKETPPAPATPPSIDNYEEPEDVAKEVAASSLTEDNTIATETLAGILERQGHFDKAIKMYEKLSLQFPEKSSTFAAKIEKLRKK